MTHFDDTSQKTAASVEILVKKLQRPDCYGLLPDRMSRNGIEV